MNFCKKIFILLNILYFFLATPLSAQEFKVVDLQRLLRNHPMTASYDAVTGRFKNTPSEIFSLEELQSRIGNLQQEMERLNAKKAVLAAQLLVDVYDRKNEESLWKRIRAIDDQILLTKNDLAAKNDLLHAGGRPGVDKLQKVTKEIFADIRSQHFKQNRAVVLNRLPGYAGIPIRIHFGYNDLLSFLYTRSDTALKSYLSHSYDIGMLLSVAAEPVLYQKGRQNDK